MLYAMQGAAAADELRAAPAICARAGADALKVGLLVAGPGGLACCSLLDLPLLWRLVLMFMQQAQAIWLIASI